MAAIISVSAHAQTMPERKNDGVNKERTEKRGDVYKDLNLTTDQQQKMKALREEGRTQMEVIRNDNGLTQEEKKAKYQTMREGQEEKMNAILSVEQRTKMQEMRNSQKGRDYRKTGTDKKGIKQNASNKKSDGLKKSNDPDKDPNGMSKKANDRRGNNLMKDLNLTDDQKKQMKSMNEETRSKMQALRSNTTLTEEQKKGQMQDLMKEIQIKRNSILTAEQKTKWEANEKQMRTQRVKKAGTSQNKII